MPSNDLSHYAEKEAILGSWLENAPATFSFLVDYIQRHLDNYFEFMLPAKDTGSPDEQKERTEALSAFFDEAVDSLKEDLLIEDLPWHLDLRCMDSFILRKLLAQVWHQDFHNAKVRERYRDAEAHLEKRRAELKRKWHPSIPESRKKAKVADTVAGFTPEMVLDSLLDTLRQYHSARYGSIMNDEAIDLKDIVLSNLAPQLEKMFLDGVPTTQQDLEKLDTDTTQRKAAVYMHLVNHYRYVGQARDLNQRIWSQHMSKFYRNSHPCLHYRVMDALPNAESIWVVLAYLPIDEVKPEYTGLLLNIFEMLGALLFQTLTQHALDVYLDPKIERQVGLVGLNIALPIHQPQEAIDNDDRGAPIHELQPCKDALVAKYYRQTTMSAVEKRRETMISKTHQDLINGSERTMSSAGLKSGRVEGLIVLRLVQLKFNSNQLKKLGISIGDTVTIRVEIDPVAAHDFTYATAALPTDPAMRLAIKCTTRAGVEHYLHSSGDEKAQIVNSLVDELEGVPLAESKKKHRRFFKKNYYK